MSFDVNKLIEQAILARENAYTPYSNFKVGAAILLKDGSYIHGCNVENASYGLCNCAERTALFKMVSEGYKKDDAVAFCIVGKTKDVISPCGACRQVMSELLPVDCRIVLANLDGKTKLTSISELLPYSFNEGDLS